MPLRPLLILVPCLLAAGFFALAGVDAPNEPAAIELASSPTPSPETGDRIPERAPASLDETAPAEAPIPAAAPAPVERAAVPRVDDGDLPPAFAAAPRDATSRVAPDALHNARRERILLDTDELARTLRGRDGARRSLLLNLFDDVGFPVVFDRVERNDPAGISLVASGRVVGVEDSDVVAVLDGDTLAANVLLPTGELYQVRAIENGLVRVKEVDREAIGDCVNDEHDHHVEAAAFDTGSGGSDTGSGGGDVAAASQSGDTLDLLVVYSPAARAAAGGVSGMDSLISLNAASINRFYSESGSTARVRVVHSAEVSYTERSGDPMDAALRDVTDGVVSGVHGLRNQYGADLVTFIVRPNPYSGTAGIAWVPNVDYMPYSDYIGFSAVAVQAFDDPTVLAHELGHNQGNNHDARTITSSGGSTSSAAARTRPYAFGYIEPSNRFHTLMAYPSSCGYCLRLGRISNPNSTYTGRATGSSSADVRRVLSETVPTIASWRAAQVSSTPPPDLNSPPAGTMLPASDATLGWVDNGNAVSDWWVYVGTEPGADDLFNSGSLAAGTRSVVVPSLPSDGRTLHVRLWAYMNGSWTSQDVSYQAYDAPVSQPMLIFPLPGSVLPPGDLTFEWSDLNGLADEWWIQVGSSLAANDVFDSGPLGSSGSVTVTGLPTDGRTLYVRIFHRMTGDPWSSVDFSVTAATVLLPPNLVSPAADSTLTAASTTLSWNDVSGLVDEAWVHIGSSSGGNDLFNSGRISGASSVDVDGLPTDGRQLFVRLFFRRSGGEWLSVDYSLTAATIAAATPVMVTPSPGATLPGAATTFQWSDPSGATTNWWLNLGTTAGGHDVLNSGNLGASTSLAVAGLPTDGSTVHARLWYRSGSGSWRSEDFSFTAATVAAPPPPSLVSPTPGSQIGASETFSWSDPSGAVTEWWLNLGTSQGGHDILNSGNLGATTSIAVNDLPVGGGNVHARLWYKASGSWASEDFTFTTPGPSVTAPTPGSTLPGATVTFQWSDPTASVTDWWLNLGTSNGGYDLLNSGRLGGGTTSLLVSGLPTDGSTIHARLWFENGSGWHSRDVTFTAAP